MEKQKLDGIRLTFVDRDRSMTSWVIRGSTPARTLGLHQVPDTSREMAEEVNISSK